MVAELVVVGVENEERIFVHCYDNGPCDKNIVAIEARHSDKIRVHICNMWNSRTRTPLQNYKAVSRSQRCFTPEAIVIKQWQRCSETW